MGWTTVFKGGYAESNPRPSTEGVSFYHVLRPLDHLCYTYDAGIAVLATMS